MRSRGLGFRAAALLAATAVLLRTRGTAATLRRLARPPRVARPVDPSAAVARVSRLGRAARTRCLTQSVALAALLVRSGLDAEVVLGCRRYAAGEWGAHAWVVSDGAKLEPVPGGEHSELARCRAAHHWVPAPPPQAVRE